MAVKMAVAGTSSRPFVTVASAARKSRHGNLARLATSIFVAEANSQLQRARLRRG